MSVFDDLFAAQHEALDFTWGSPSPADVTAAICMSGLLSDQDARWIPVAAPVRNAGDA